jgi:hypothetical protein
MLEVLRGELDSTIQKKAEVENHYTWLAQHYARLRQYTLDLLSADEQAEQKKGFEAQFPVHIPLSADVLGQGRVNRSLSSSLSHSFPNIASSTSPTDPNQAIHSRRVSRSYRTGHLPYQ